MAIDDRDRALLNALQDGLPLVSRPYAAIAGTVGMTETEVLARLARLAADGIIRRFGVVVRHRELGYGANAMTVWDVPDADAAAVGHRLASLDFVTLCYRRPRWLPDWPYNLFAMIHGHDRTAVESLVDEATTAAGLTGCQRAILFSRRRFKQRGARYAAPSGTASERVLAG